MVVGLRFGVLRELVAAFIAKTLGEGTTVASLPPEQAVGFAANMRADALLIERVSRTFLTASLAALKGSGLSIPVLAYVPSTLDADFRTQHGVAAFISEADDLEYFEEALRIVLGGGVFGPRQPEPTGRAFSLTNRQLAVLTLIVAGLSTKQIASDLGIGFKTADHHRTRLMKRLNAHCVTDLIRAALKEGLVNLD